MTGQRESAEWVGLFAVAAELTRRGWRVALTLGNTKSYDLLAKDPNSGRTVSIDVKARWREPGKPKTHHWLCSNLLNGLERIGPSHFIAFVIVNTDSRDEDQFFIVPGREAVRRLKENVALQKRQGKAKMTQFRLFDSEREDRRLRHLDEARFREWEILKSKS
jgi:hypothetical protein